MIEIVSRSGEPEAMLCPAFVCDTCRQQVTGTGHVVWSMRFEPRRETSPLFVAHKGRCDRALKTRIDAQYPLDDGWSDLWEELDVFVGQLARNRTNVFANDPDGTYRIAAVVHPHHATTGTTA